MSDLKTDNYAPLPDELPDAVIRTVGSRIIFLNNTAKEMLGLEQDHENLDIRSLIEPRTIEQLQKCAKNNKSSKPVFMGPLNLSVKKPLNGPWIPVSLRITCLPSSGLKGDNQHWIFSIREQKDSERTARLISSLVELAAYNVESSGKTGVLKAAGRIFVELGWWAGLMRTNASGVEIIHLLSPEKMSTHPVVKFANRIMDEGLIPWSRYPVMRKAYETGKPVFFDDAPENLLKTGGIGEEFSVVLNESGFSRCAWVPVLIESRTSHVLLVVGPDLTENDLSAIQLFAAQISATLRMEDLQRALVRKERLAAVGEMAGVLAHEVRNPLAVIFNAVAGLKKISGDNDEHNLLLSIIQQEGERLKRVISDLLDFSEPSCPEIRPLKVQTIVSNTLDAVRSKKKFKEIKATNKLKTDMPAVEGDPHLLKKVFFNIFENAFVSALPDGTVEIDSEEVENEELLVRVKNDSAHLSEEDTEKAFLPFYTTRPRGTGLGLTVVRKIVEDTGGRVNLMHKSGKTTLSLFLKKCRNSINNYPAEGD